MAANAIGHLRQAALVGPHDGASTPIAHVASRVSDAAAVAGARFEIRTRGIGSRSIPAAARHLCASGADELVNLRQAIWDYNHADWYVDRVLAAAARYGELPAIPPRR